MKLVLTYASKDDPNKLVLAWLDLKGKSLGTPKLGKAGPHIFFLKKNE